MVKWTENQKKIFDLKNFKDGKIIVNACPGSGKSSCVTERIINFIQMHENTQNGLAILSFTNVAIEEIKENFKKSTNEKITYPHYIGTLDSFINKFIFFPFGHLVTGYKKRPIMVGEPHNKWYHKNYNCQAFDKISYGENREIVKVAERLVLDDNKKEAKRKLTKNGYATQEDANYFVTEILEKYPDIAQLISMKFPYMIIDEAQDMSKNQMKMIDLLIENGLKNILLVGDPYQSLFEWRTAKPELFENKCKSWGEGDGNLITLEHTFRCSKNISKYLSRLSKSEIKSNADNKINEKPKLIPHNKTYEKIVEKFLNDIKKYSETSVSKNNTAILFRSKNEMNNYLKSNNTQMGIENIFKDMSNTLQKNKLDIYPKNLKNYTGNIIKGEYYLLHGDLYNGFKEFELAYIKTQSRRYNEIQPYIDKRITKEGIYKYRMEVLSFIKSFQKPAGKDQLIDEWISEHNQKYKEKNGIYLNYIKTRDKKLNLNPNEKLTWAMLLLDNQQNFENYYIGTIHSVKGRTFDSVLLIVNSNKKMKLEENLIENDELRNIYVGMSRAKYLLRIVVPNDAFKEWKNFFEQDRQTKLI